MILVEKSQKMFESEPSYYLCDYMEEYDGRSGDVLVSLVNYIPLENIPTKKEAEIVWIIVKQERTLSGVNKKNVNIIDFK